MNNSPRLLGSDPVAGCEDGYCTHFTDEETEIQAGEVPCPGSHSRTDAQARPTPVGNHGSLNDTDHSNNGQDGTSDSEQTPHEGRCCPCRGHWGKIYAFTWESKEFRARKTGACGPSSATFWLCNFCQIPSPLRASVCSYTKGASKHPPCRLVWTERVMAVKTPRVL